MCDGNPSPIKDIGHNESIPADVTSTPTPKKPPMAQECPAPVYMAKVYNCDTDSDDDTQSLIMTL